jgi:hypothetical protein
MVRVQTTLTRSSSPNSRATEVPARKGLRLHQAGGRKWFKLVKQSTSHAGSGAAVV